MLMTIWVRFTYLTLSLLTASCLPASTAYAADVTLTWAANTESDLAGYKLYQGTVSGKYGPPVTLGKVTTYTVTLPSLTIDQTYFWALSAYDLANNESGKSVEISKLIAGVPAVTKPGTPVLTVAAKDTELLVAWTPVPDGAGGAALLDIRLGASTDQWGAMVSQNCPASPCRIAGLSPNTAYQVQAVAYRGTLGSGTAVFGALSAPVSVKTTAPVDLPPAAPSGFTISSATAGEVVLTASLADCPSVRFEAASPTYTITCGR